MIEPLVPLDLDLTSFEFMPVEWGRLLSSDTWMLCSDAEKVAAITLWGRSWAQVPAGSLPQDDRLLAALSGAGRGWKKVKPMALRGWVLASDGRYYHPVVCEKALEAWLEKLAAQISSGAGNAKRWHTEFDPKPIKEQMVEARKRLMALNPDSRQLKKKRFTVAPEAIPDDSHSSPDGMLLGSQQTVTATGTEKLSSDTSSRLEVSEGSADDLARALHGVGYPDCSSTFPDLVAAKREGVTGQELAAIALSKPGKPLAYVIETARGKRRDAIERAGSSGATTAAPIDPATRAERDARHELDRRISQANGDFELHLIGADVRDQRIAEARAEFRRQFPDTTPRAAARQAVQA